MTDQTPPPHPQSDPQSDYANARASAKAAKAYAKASRPWYRKKRWWLLGIVVLIIIVAAAGGGGDDSGPTKVESDGSTSKGSDDDKSGDHKSGGKKTFSVGDTVLLEGTKYTVTKASTDDAVGGEFLREKANGVYIIVQLTIENTKDETKTFSDSAAKVIAGNRKKYSSDTDAIFAIDPDGDSLIFAAMQPDVPLDGTLVFDVPKAAVKGSKLEVSDLFGRGEAQIDLGL